MNKKGSAMVWIIVIIILIAIGIGVYFWLSGGDTTPVNGASGVIPTPPSLPS